MLWDWLASAFDRAEALSAHSARFSTLFSNLSLRVIERFSMPLAEAQ
jgi:hypothetical protein